MDGFIFIDSNVPQVICKFAPKLIISESKTHKSYHRLKNSNNIQ